MPDNPLTRRNLTTAPEEGVREVDWVSGALMLIRRDTFDAVGGFDDRFFLYWEDADFCKRAATAGWTTWYAPVAEVVHRTARASRHAPIRSLAAFHVSAFRYYWKHGGTLARLLSPIVAFGLLGRFVIRLASGN
jgi:GT2 family glycosyltransferase